MRARSILVTVGVAIVVVLLWMLSTSGVPFDFALSWFLLAAVLVALTRQVFVDESQAWPPPEPPRTPRGSDVSRLAWAINPRTGAVGHTMLVRVERTVRRRLGAHGVDLDDPRHHGRADALLGPGVRELLQRREVQRSDVERILDAVDRLSRRIEEED